MGTALPLSAMLLQTILLSEEGYIIDFGTAPMQIVFHGLMVLVLIFAIAKLLIKPVQNMLQKRQDAIQQTLDNAADQEKKAAELKADYEQKLADASKERDEILKKAYSSAKEKEAQVIKEARDEAERMRDRARRDIEQEREKARDEPQQHQRLREHAPIERRDEQDHVLEPMADADQLGIALQLPCQGAISFHSLISRTIIIINHMPMLCQ